MYGTPDPSNPYNPGFPPGVQQFHQPHYPSPSHHYPGGMPGVDNTGGSYHESFNTPGTPQQQNEQWSRQQQSQQPSVVINDGGAVSDAGSPAPRSSIGWGPSGVRGERGKIYIYNMVAMSVVYILSDFFNNMFCLRKKELLISMP